MKTEKTCQRCKQIRPISDFVDTSGAKNPRGKYCIKCYVAREKGFLREALKEEKSNISKLRIVYGKYWKHYALPHNFSTTLFNERDFCPYCGVELKRDSHIDHMNPLELGGEESIKNAVFCCSSCNIKKGSKPFLMWLKQLKPKYRKIAREIYTAKHGYPPEKFKKGTQTQRAGSGCLDYGLLFDEDELKKMYPEPIVDGPPEKEFNITISLDTQKFMKNKNSKR